MEKNVGGYDRILRAVLGPVLIIVAAAMFGGLLVIATATLQATIAVVALLVGAVLTATAITQKCPLNRAFGINTYKGAMATERGTDAPRPRA
jgi:hypothetical protein